MEVLLDSFHLNGHTLGFHPQTEKSQPLCTAGFSVVFWSDGQEVITGG